MTYTQRFVEWIAQSRKAIVAGGFVFVAILAPLAGDGVSLADVLTSIAAAGVSGGVTYSVPNRKA